MSAAVCLLASLLSCPYPDTGPRVRPSLEHTQSIKHDRLVRPTMPIAARFGPNERFGPADPQVSLPFIFSKLEEKAEPVDQDGHTKVSTVDRLIQKPKARTKITVETTRTKTVEKAYAEEAPLNEQWRLSNLFGIRNADTALSLQSVPRVSGVEMAKPGYQEVIRAAKIHQVPVDLALRVAKQESRGNCGAKSSAGALGVMQVMPRTGAKHGYSTKQLSNCRTGAEAGVKELKHLLKLSGGDIKQTLTGYNCGEQCMFGKRKKLPLETVNYIQIVTRN